MSLQTHLICFLEPVLKLVNKYIQERDLKIITLQDTPQEVSLFILSQGMFLLRFALALSHENILYLL